MAVAMTRQRIAAGSAPRIRRDSLRLGRWARLRRYGLQPTATWLDVFSTVRNRIAGRLGLSGGAYGMD